MEERGSELPEWYLDCPELGPTDHVFLEAFHRLSSCRAYTFGGAGPIPWTAIEQYGQHMGFNRNLQRVLDTVVRVVDAAWLQWQVDNRPKGGKG